MLSQGSMPGKVSMCLFVHYFLSGLRVDRAKSGRVGDVSSTSRAALVR